MKTPLFCLLIFIILIFFSNCASLYKPPIQKPLSDQIAATIISRIRQQEKRVSSFYTAGFLTMKNWYSESESNILIVGTRDPFRIKIEITHQWGQPILHVLIDQTRLEVLSFADKKLYLGAFTPMALSRFFPGQLDSGLIWAALRGFPNLMKHHSFVSLKTDQISLFNKKEKEIQIIDIYPESFLPRMASFPEQQIRLAYSDFQEDNGVYYAQVVKLDHKKGKRTLILKNRKMIFNKTIPEQIFILKKPPSFEIHQLKENG